METISCQLSVVSCQLSVVSCQLSVVSCQLSVVSGCSPSQRTTDNGLRTNSNDNARDVITKTFGFQLRRQAMQGVGFLGKQAGQVLGRQVGAGADELGKAGRFEESALLDQAVAAHDDGVAGQERPEGQDRSAVFLEDGQLAGGVFGAAADAHAQGAGQATELAHL